MIGEYYLQPFLLTGMQAKLIQNKLNHALSISFSISSLTLSRKSSSDKD